MRCNRCHKPTDQFILVSVKEISNDINLSEIDVKYITTAKICPKCSHELRDWLYQNGSLEIVKEGADNV